VAEYIFPAIGISWVIFWAWVATCRTTPISDKEVEIDIFGRRFRMPRVRRGGRWLIRRRP